MPSYIQHSDVDFLARLFKGLEIGDHVIGNTPGGFKIHAARGAGHESYANFKPADHIVAANMHAKEARNLNIKATQLGGSATLKRQAANHLNIAAGHREMGSGAAQTKLAASLREMNSMQAAQLYSGVLRKAEGARGGKVIGHTKSGKPIYQANHDKYKHVLGTTGRNSAEASQLSGSAAKNAFRAFSADDHNEAATMHHKRAIKPGDEHDRAGDAHRSAAKQIVIAGNKKI